MPHDLVIGGTSSLGGIIGTSPTHTSESFVLAPWIIGIMKKSFGNLYRNITRISRESLENPAGSAKGTLKGSNRNPEGILKES